MCGGPLRQREGIAKAKVVSVLTNVALGKSAARPNVAKTLRSGPFPAEDPGYNPSAMWPPSVNDKIEPKFPNREVKRCAKSPLHAERKSAAECPCRCR
jgi:hypothetical protein